MAEPQFIYLAEARDDIYESGWEWMGAYLTLEAALAAVVEKLQGAGTPPLSFKPNNLAVMWHGPYARGEVTITRITVGEWYE